MNRSTFCSFLALLICLGVPGAAHGADVCPYNGTGVVRVCVNSDSNAGLLLDLNGAPQWSLATVSGGDFQIFDETGASNSLYIETATGDVGLGTAAPEERLHVAKNGRSIVLLESNQLSGVELRAGAVGPAAPIWWGMFTDTAGNLSFLSRPDNGCRTNCPPPALQLLQDGSLHLNAVLETDLQMDSEIRCLRQGIGGKSPGCLPTTAFGDRVVTRPKIALDAVDSTLLADNSVGLAELQANAVDSSKVKDASLGAADVVPAQIQLRIAQACPAGSTIRSVGQDGKVACEVSVCVPGTGKGSMVCSGTSFGLGRAAAARHAGVLVLADGNKEAFSSTAANEFSVRATGGVRFVSSLKGVGVRLASGGNSWSALSDRNLKENFTMVDGREVLERLSRIPVSRWNLTSQPESIHHLGPTAQDFFAAFGLGESELYIDSSDADGVALISVQALYGMASDLEAKVREVEKKTAQLDELRARVDEMERALAALSAKPQ